MFERVINLIGEEEFKKIQNTKILLVGVGGVGSFVLEGLVRSGFQNITIIDGDLVEETNINRQLVANLTTIGQYKVDVAKKNMENINNYCHIKPIRDFLDENNINTLEDNFDYVIDACDTLKAKFNLLKYADKNKWKIISCMGVGNRVDATKIKLTTLDKTNNDPLAKKLRKLVKENDIKISIPVICSDELPSKNAKVNSLITTPGVAGLLIVNYIINDLIFSNQKSF